MGYLIQKKKQSFDPLCDFLGIGSIVQGVAGLASAGLNAAATREENERQREFQHDEAQLAYNRQLELYNTEKRDKEEMYNKYSSPEALARQYEAAGLNRALAMSGGSAGAVQTASPTSAAQAGNAGGNVPNLNGLLEIGPALMAAAEAKSRIKLNDANAAKASAEAQRTEGLLPFEIRSAQNKLALDRLGIKNAEFDNALKEIAVTRESATLPYSIEEARLRVDQIKAGLDKIDAEIDLMFSQRQLNEQSAKLVYEQVQNAIEERVILQIRQRAESVGIELTQAQIASAFAQVGMFQSQTRVFDQTAVKTFYERQGKRIENARAIKAAKYDGFNNYVNSVRNTIGAIGDIVDIAVDVVASSTPGGAALKTVTETVSDTYNGKGKLTKSTVTRTESGKSR